MPEERGASPGRDHARDQNDHARDQNDHARDQNDHARDHSQNRGGSEGPFDGPRQFAKNYPDPLGEGQLQVWPPRVPSEFDSLDDFFTWLDALERWKLGRPPPRPMPSPEDATPRVPAPGPAGVAHYLKSRHVGVRLTEADYELLAELARAHSVPLGTMARMLIVRGVRAAADAATAGEQER